MHYRNFLFGIALSFFMFAPRLFSAEKVENNVDHIAYSSTESVSRIRYTLALLSFDPTDATDELKYLRNGIPDMLASVLSGIPEIALVERERLKQVLDEKKLTLAGFMQHNLDSVCSLAGVDYFVTGRFYNVDHSLHIHARIIDAQTALIMQAIDIQGQFDQNNQVFDLINNLGYKLISAIGLEGHYQLLSSIRNENTSSANAAYEFYQGLAYYDNKSYDQSMHHFKKSIRLDPNYEKANHYCILAFEKQNNKYQSSLVCFYDSLIQIYPTNPILYNYLGRTYSALNEIENARRAYEKSISLKNNYATPYNNLGDYYFKKEDYQQALVLFKDALRFGIYDPAIVECNLGLVHEQIEEFQVAESHYQRALQIQPVFYEIHFYLGNLYSHQNKYTEAIKEYLLLIRDLPEHINGLLNLGIVYFKSEKIDDAIKQFQRIISLYPDHTDANLNLAACYMSQTQFRQAEAIYNNLLIKMEHPLIYENLGEIAFARQDTLKAIQYWEKVLLGDSTHLHCNFLLGKLYFSQKQYTKATHYFNRISQNIDFQDQSEDFRIAYFVYYANACEKTGDLFQAEIYYRRVLRLDPENFIAKIRLKNIEKMKNDENKK